MSEMANAKYQRAINLAAAAVQAGSSSDMALEVAKGLIIMAEVLANPRPLTGDLVHAWGVTLAMAGVAPQDVQKGVGKLLATATFFPAPSDFLRALRPQKDVLIQAEIAWLKTRECIRKYGWGASLSIEDFGGDGTALWTVAKMGWERLCRDCTSEKIAIWSAEFRRIYVAAFESGYWCRYLAGYHESLNAGRFEVSGYELGRPDWKQLPVSRAIMPSIKAIESGESPDE